MPLTYANELLEAGVKQCIWLKYTNHPLGIYILLIQTANQCTSPIDILLKFCK